jgi:hypothetical protein
LGDFEVFLQRPIAFDSISPPRNYSNVSLDIATAWVNPIQGGGVVLSRVFAVWSRMTGDEWQSQDRANLRNYDVFDCQVKRYPILFASEPGSDKQNLGWVLETPSSMELSITFVALVTPVFPPIRMGRTKSKFRDLFREVAGIADSFFHKPSCFIIQGIKQNPFRAPLGIGEPMEGN